MSTRDRRDLARLLQDFIDVKLDGRLDDDLLDLIRDQAENYAQSVGDYWPDHDVLVILSEWDEEQIILKGNKNV